MLKKPASIRRPLFGLSGLSGFLVEQNYSDEPNQPDKQNKPDQPDRQTGLVLDVRVSEDLACHNLWRLTYDVRRNRLTANDPFLSF
jgi:hypothetical protein